MSLVLKIIGVIIIALLLLGWSLNSLPYPFNLVGAIAVIAGFYHIVVKKIFKK